jgi:predicted HTH transcriptional regulator
MKDFKEKFARFFEKPTREDLRDILQFNYGELDNLDFKADWSSLTKIAKHLLAFANSGGGCIIIGVLEKENSLKSVGIDKLLDKAEFHDGIKSYIPKNLDYYLLDFTFNAAEYSDIIGKTFQVLIIEDTPKYLPFVSKNNGKGISGNTIYVREGTKSVKTSYQRLQKIINRKIETNYSTKSEIKLEEHLSHLEVLYSYIKPYKKVRKNSNLFSKAFIEMTNNAFGEIEKKENPVYPEENFEEFIVKIIKIKKQRIKELLLR